MGKRSQQIKGMNILRSSHLQVNLRLLTEEKKLTAHTFSWPYASISENVAQVIRKIMIQLKLIFEIINNTMYIYQLFFMVRKHG